MVITNGNYRRLFKKNIKNILQLNIFIMIKTTITTTQLNSSPTNELK